MKTLKVAIPALAILAAVGCIDVAEKQDVDEVATKIDKLNAQVAQKNDMQALLYEEVVKRVTGMEKKVGELDILTNTMKAQVARLEDQVKTLNAQVEALSKAPPAGPVGVPGQPPAEQAKTLKIEEILLEIQTVLAELRTGKIKVDEAAAKLKPWAQHAAPQLVTELRNSLAKFEYAKQLEFILAKFPPAELKVPLQDGLRQRGVREAAARVIGATGDKELSHILEEYVGETDEDFRLAVGDALVRCHNGAGIPLLLSSLRSEQSSTRTIAISALKKINRGLDMGYKPQLPPESNAEGLKAWDDWSEKYAKNLFD
ncbi:MAG TPA: HEAT repeat domain-containing protein [Planctomycetota bacterium]|nr:HEAT repeat domain-containing protein [Planctomycetota bacterium]